MSSSVSDSSQSEQRRIMLRLAYDGTDFHGWAKQPGLRTVQGCLEEALALVLRREVAVVVAGRTDTGVHAREQVVHLDVSEGEREAIIGRSGRGFSEAMLRRLEGALSRVLGDERGAIVVAQVSEVPKVFDARFSALSRSYIYRINDSRRGWDPLTRKMTWWISQELDLEAMRGAAQHLKGLKDFFSFCKAREGATTLRTLLNAEVTREQDGLVLVRFSADAFCHHMVRNMVAALVEVGKGAQEPEWILERFEPGYQGKIPAMAPSRGLCLDSVTYPDEDELEARNVQTRALRSHPELG